MTTDHIRYDLLTQDALRGVVKRVLVDAAREGLPGEHHFYISFKTQYPGVKISNRLAEKYPDEITIVLQHQFWDLAVSDFGFEVGLSFGNAPEKLIVPFEAVCGFYDPSAQFGLKFEVVTDEPVQGDIEQRPAPRGAASEPHEAPAGRPRAKAVPSSAKAEPGAKVPASEAKPAKPLKVVEAGEEEQAESGEKIVSLDTFRKKK
ncbi:SspB family protein [Labrys wisconsinensis]|uniref:Stringent starvation protein B n=1 Tax=Labrys wisconsinensis TaxID=425677 RepID=A0ABU0JEB2_9HYPH|nr:ClpXP protease specificity-enhancing factor SspB [Labrys wisconsinensis]MDQ0471482.1 hypothetical protein [Labrys wisconsinensis]